MAFRFRLEQVRLYRKQVEEQAMQTLAAAVMRRDEAQARLNALYAELEAVRVRLASPHAMTAAEFWLEQQYENAVRQDIETAKAALAELELTVDACRTDLIKKSQERGLLDKLKEKQAARAAMEERQQEQRNYDETATLRYRPALV